MNRFRLVSVTMLATCLRIVGIAQESPASEDAIAENEMLEKEPVRFFSVMANTRDSIDEIYFRSEKNAEAQLMEFIPGRRSRVYEIPLRENEIEFFERTKDDRGRDAERIVGRAEINRIGGRFLVIFEPSGERVDWFEIEIADESLDAFPPGSFRFLNLTGADLKAQIGASTLHLESGISDTIEFDPQIRLPIGIRASVLIRNEWTVVGETKTQSSQNAGTLLVLMPPKRYDDIYIRIYANRQRLRQPASPEN